MPDVVRAKLAEALRDQHAMAYDDDAAMYYCDCGMATGDYRVWADHMADVLLSLEGVAIVALPTLMVDRSNVAESIKDRPMWEVGGAWTSLTDNAGEIEFEADSQNACGCLNSPAEARAFAAALLAAADAAEAVKR